MLAESATCRQNGEAESTRQPAADNGGEMSHTHWLRLNLSQALALPELAVSWLIMLFEALQVFDDYADGDPVTRTDLNGLIWNTLVSMPANPFYQAHQTVLLPLLGTMILKWQASDTAERNGEADAKSFVWRAGYYDLVLMVVNLVHGSQFATEKAHLVMALYGEQYEEYLKEFGNA